MERPGPIRTEKKECRDCCRCVRNCPVKAIRIEAGSAAVMAERCIACGRCVDVCPVKAKRVRDDMPRVRELLATRADVVVSLAPSYVTEFPGVPAPALVRAIKRLGFAAVSETALGAAQISAAVADGLRDRTPRLLVSSACPVVVDLVCRYLPEHAAAVTELCSPLLAHCRLLRQTFGPDTQIVFIGPCIAKKNEADRWPEWLAAAIGFAELKEWLACEGIHPAAVRPGPEDRFVPESAVEGRIYPVDGGMVAGIRRDCSVSDCEFMSFSGVENVRAALRDVTRFPLRRPLFLELLGCEGGCVNGPLAGSRDGTIAKRLRVLDTATACPPVREPGVRVDTHLPRRGEPVPEPRFPETRLRDALGRIGKRRPEDELNCNGCGYGTCREFAVAMLAGKAEAAMCVSHMRSLAGKKANALIRSVPAGVVMADADLRVVECNRRFARMVGEDVTEVFDAKPGLEGADLTRIAPFLTDRMRRVLQSGGESPDIDLRHGNRVFHVSVFVVEENAVAGAILSDVTEPAVRRDRVLRRARDVMSRQMRTVQQIACLLGENAAESKVSLDAIIASYGSDAPETGEDDHAG